MPKRTRCPHCDRLFSRDKIDDHIRRCRFRVRKEMTESTPERRRIVVVDGNNVVFHLAYDGKPKIANLIRAMNSLISSGYRPKIVVSAALRHRIDRPEQLRELVREGKIVEAPRGTNDDLRIISLAQKLNADIVSNDRFLDWIDRYPWIPDRLRRYRMTPSGLLLS